MPVRKRCEKMYCPKCGRPVPEGARFCPDCGASMDMVYGGDRNSASSTGTSSGDSSRRDRVRSNISYKNDTESNISLLAGFILAILATIFLTPVGGFVAGMIFMLLATGVAVLGMVPGNRVFLLGAGGIAGFLVGCLLWIII